MKKILSLLLLINSLSWSATYDPFLLTTHLSLLPKIAILDKNLVSRNKSTLKILIAYEYGDEEAAESCSKILMTKFNGNVNGHPLIVTALPFDKLDGSNTYHLIYALKASLSQQKKIHNAVGSSGALTALYDANKLADDGLLLSIQMEREPVILINSKALKETRFSFPDSLLAIARII